MAVMRHAAVAKSVVKLKPANNSVAVPESEDVERHFVGLRGQVGEMRLETFQGREHTVVPIVAIVEGVIQAVNAETPELVEKAVFSRTAEAWNGRPVLINHPRRNGELVSANAPDMLDLEQIGTLFSSKVKNNKLVMEAWIDNTASETAEGDKETVLTSVLGGETVEVSIGAFVDVEPTKGKFKGKAFEGRWTNVVPDHLAILTLDKTGACSVEMGCGTNRAAMRTACGPGCTCTKEPVGLEWLTDAVKSAGHEIATALGLAYVERHGELSDMDTRSLLERALEEEHQNEFIMVVAVFADRVVYARGNRLFEQGFTIQNDSEVTFEDDVVEVLPRTDFIRVGTQKECNMTKEELIAKIVASAATRFGEDDKKWLEGLAEDQLEKLMPVSEPENAVSEGAVKKDEVVGDDPDDQSSAEPTTVESYLEGAPESIREVLSEGISLRDAKRAHYIDGILKSPRNEFSKDDLVALDMKSLERLAKLAEAPDYSSRGAPIKKEAGDDKPKAAPKLAEQFKRKSAA